MSEIPDDPEYSPQAAIIVDPDLTRADAVGLVFTPEGQFGFFAQRYPAPLGSSVAPSAGRIDPTIMDGAP